MGWPELVAPENMVRGLGLVEMAFWACCVLAPLDLLETRGSPSVGHERLEPD